MSVYLREEDGPLGFGYTRSSTNKQELSTSVQEENIKTAAVKLGAVEGFRYAHTFCDEAISGKKFPFSERPDARRLMDVVRPKDHVFVWKFDRFGRSIKDIVGVLEYFVKQEVSIHCLQHGQLALDLTTSSGRLMVHILAAFADFESCLISERTKEAIAYRKHHGINPAGGHIMYGKKRHRDIVAGPNGTRLRFRYEDCPEEVALIRRAYEMMDIKGTSLTDTFAIAKRENWKTAEGAPWTRVRLYEAIRWYRRLLAEGRSTEMG